MNRDPLDWRILRLPSLVQSALCLVAGLTLVAPLPAEELNVLAAASLTDALKEIGAAFEAATGHTIVYNLGASNDLARQIRAGAPADVFFSADKRLMDGLEKEGLVRARDRLDVLSNVLVVVVPADSPARVASPADLLPFPRLVLADPEAVPAGVYARAWLESVGQWDELKGRVVPALNVRAALSAVESGNAEAGIVYRTDAAISKRARVAFEVPREQGPAIVYPLAPLAASRKAATSAFVRALTSPSARAVYLKHGFVVLGGT